MGFEMRHAVPLMVLLACMLAGCSSSPEPRASEPKAAESKGAETTRRVERARDANPDNAEVRVKLASEYYRRARKALDENDEAQYRTYLSKAQDELIAAIRIDPTDPTAHIEMGIIQAYQGNMSSAKTSFTNALRLHKKRRPRGEPGDGIFYTNIAHISVYLGDIKAARRYIEVGRKHGAPPDELDRIDTLIAWRSGDQTEAREVFSAAAEVTPGFADTWDGAPLPQKMKTFDDFCAACCRNPSCGPHMADACKAEQQEVKQREVTRETLQEEMRLERERRAALKEVYEKRRDVSIEVEKDEPEKPEAAGTPAVPAAKPKR